jgi:pectinesterase
MARDRSLLLGLVLASSLPACSGDNSGPSKASNDDASVGNDAAGGGSDGGSGDATMGGDSQAPNDAGSQDGSTTSDAGAPGAPDASCALGDASIGTCTNTAPHLDDAGVANLTTLKYLAQAGIITAGLLTDNWNPTAGVGDVSTFTATFTVAATGGTHTTVQAAIDAAVAMGGTTRLYIDVTPGTYREVVCVPTSAPPITLYSTNADASQTVIVYNNYNGLTLDAGAAINPCARPSSTATTFGTAGSSTFISLAKGFQAKNITFSNDVSTTTLAGTSGTQAVALMTEADQIVLENVRALGHQDTLYIETSSAGTVLRAYVKNSYISGDVDFIFGGATFVLDGCTINFASDRRGTGDVLSPSTDVRNPYGILVTNSTFSADPSTAANSVTLGRAWDRSSTDLPTYVSTLVPTCGYPNGQALVRDSVFSAAYNATTPWSPAATSKRPFCSNPWVCTDAGAGVCPANRLFEFDDTAPDGGAL